MIVESASWPQIQEVLKDTFAIWSSGLDREHYYEFIRWQLEQPWSKNHYSFFIANNDNNIVSSCKLYDLSLKSGAEDCRIAGIGAVYTPERYRGSGYATEFLKSILTYCKDQDYDGVMLYSDIGVPFYQRLGFQTMGNGEFYLFLKDAPSVPREAEGLHPVPVTPADAGELLQHYRRWLETQELGSNRSHDYWSYKLGREHFVHRHSKKWPQAEAIFDHPDRSKASGYALVEQGDRIMRVLEVIGSPESADKLWDAIIRISLTRTNQLIRGWEGVCPGFKAIKTVARDEACPMLLAWRKNAQQWLKATRCPLLELDHF